MKLSFIVSYLMFTLLVCKETKVSCFQMLKVVLSLQYYKLYLEILSVPLFFVGYAIPQVSNFLLKFPADFENFLIFFLSLHFLSYISMKTELMLLFMFPQSQHFFYYFSGKCCLLGNQQFIKYSSGMLFQSLFGIFSEKMHSLV